MEKTDRKIVQGDNSTYNENNYIHRYHDSTNDTLLKTRIIIQGNNSIYNTNYIDNIVINTIDYKKLTEEIRELQKENTNHFLIEEKLEQIEILKRKVLDLSNIFSNININNERLKQAKAFFENSELDKANDILNEEQIDKDLELIIYEEEKAKNVLEKTTKAREQISDEYLLKAILSNTSVVNEPDWINKTLNLFEKSIKVDVNYKNLSIYSAFCFDNNFLELAKSGFEKLLSIITNRNTKEIGEDKYYLLAETSHDIALIYLKMNDYIHSEKKFKQALTYYKKSLSYNKNSHFIATITSNIAFLQRETYKFEEGKNNYIKAVNIHKKLYSIDGEKYMSEYAQTLASYATFLTIIGDYKESEIAHKESIELFDKLAKQNPDIYLYHLSLCYNNLGMLLASLLKYDEAEENFEKSLIIARIYADIQPSKYLPDKAIALLNLAKIQYEKNEFDEIEENLQESLSLFIQLEERNPQTHSSHIIICLKTMSTASLKLKKYTEARKYIEEAISYIHKLMLQNPEVYIYDYVDVHCHLAAIFTIENKVKESKKIYTKILEILANSKDQKSIRHLSCLSKCLYLLAITNENEKCYNEAKNNMIQSIQIQRKLCSNKNNTTEILRLASSLTFLCKLYVDKYSEEKEECIQYAKEAYDLLTPIYYSNTSNTDISMLYLLSLYALSKSGYDCSTLD